MGYSPCGHKESDMNEQLSTYKDDSQPSISKDAKLVDTEG